MKRIISMTLGLTLLLCGCSDRKKDQSIICHVGGTMRPVVERLSEMFEAETGYKVEVNSAGSGELLAHVEMQKSGDVYVCHDPFMDILMQKFKMGVDGWTISELTPCIVVQKGNPKGIKGLKDLTREDVSVFFTDYKRSTLGRMLSTIFSKIDVDFDKFNREKKNINTNKSGSYVANMVKMKNADAAMCWTAVAALRKEDLDVIPIPERHLPIPHVDAISSATNKMYPLTPVRVTVATLTCSTNPEIAKKFAEYLVSDKVTKVFEEYGYVMKGIKKEYANGKQLEVRK